MQQPVLLERLHKAVMKNSGEDVYSAIQAGAVVDCGKDGKSSLLWAVLFKRTEAVDVLLQAGASIKVIYLDKSLVEHAIELGDLESASLLVKYGASPSIHEAKIKQYVINRLHSGIRNDSNEEIKRAIYLGVDINDQNALFQAVQLKKYEAAKALIQQEANLKGTLIEAMKYPDFKIAMLLLKNGANFDEYMPTPHPRAISIIERALQCHSANEAWVLEFLQEVINKGYDINSDSYSRNLWYPAFQHTYGNPKIIEFLIRNHANVNQTINTNSFVSNTSWTPLFLAIFCNNLESVKALITAGANVNQQASPSLYAFFNHPSVIGSCTPLFYAIKTNHIEIAEFLTQHGANL